jgi:L-2-hydroxyglutarate oxidase
VNSVGVVGGGILGLAVARELSTRYPGIAITVFEKEDRVAAHQTGHNSGVVHAGVYYKPGSLKAQLCRRGAGLLREFCEEHDVRYRELGKLIVASSAEELPGLAEIEAKARSNGVPGIRRIGREEITDIEPYVTGVAAVHSPHTAATDYIGVCHALVGEIEHADGKVVLETPVTGIKQRPAGVEVSSGEQEWVFDRLFVCAGLQGETVGRLAGEPADLRIIPFRGEYYALRPEARHRVRGMVYPVPDPRYPFLGVHLTRDVADGVHVGPNAVMALALEGYRRRDIDFGDLRRILAWPGTWRLARRHWRNGIRELRGSLSTRAYLREARKYLPSLTLADLVPATAGVRAQAVDRQGDLVDDFVLTDAGRIFLVRNAPSPGATSSLAIAEHIVTAATSAQSALN